MKKMFYLTKYNFKIFITHKIDFFLNVLNIFINQIVTLTFIYITIKNLPSLNGWKINELVLIYGLYLINKGSADFFSAGIYNLEEYIQEGFLDSLMIRPCPILLQIFSTQFDFFQLINIFLGWGLISYYFLLDIKKFNIYAVLIILLYQFISVLCIFFLKVMTMSIAFWTQTGYPVTSSIDNLSAFAKYPLDIYNTFISSFLTFIFPYAFISFYPAILILNKSNNKKILLLTMMITVSVIIISSIVWKVGLKRYESSGH
ncbi:ABC transporter permease [Lactobacillus isalae]|uniref:ABC transporter permease n=1 Tax=Lactobacillus isalae TaxID=2993455 RepID=UPI0024A7D7E1|nr:ABC-2 family transporter protein [Lactobacillus isalae]